MTTPDLDLYDVAYLAGGRDRVVDTAIVALVAAAGSGCTPPASWPPPTCPAGTRSRPPSWTSWAPRDTARSTRSAGGCSRTNGCSTSAATCSAPASSGGWAPSSRRNAAPARGWRRPAPDGGCSRSTPTGRSGTRRRHGWPWVAGRPWETRSSGRRSSSRRHDAAGHPSQAPSDAAARCCDNPELAAQLDRRPRGRRRHLPRRCHRRWRRLRRRGRRRPATGAGSSAGPVPRRPPCAAGR